MNNTINRNSCYIGNRCLYYAIMPHIKKAEDSLLLPDFDGALYAQYGEQLAKNGYHIIKVDAWHNHNYDPICYLAGEQDLYNLADVILLNTTSILQDDFFKKGEKMLLVALLALAKTKNMSIKQVIECCADINEDGDEILMRDNSVKKYYEVFKKMSGKTSKSVFISVMNRLTPFLLDNVDVENEIDLSEITNKKTAIFVTLSSTSTAFRVIAACLYSQVINVILKNREALYESRAFDANKFIPWQIIINAEGCIKLPHLYEKMATARKNMLGYTLVTGRGLRSFGYNDDDAKSLLSECSEITYVVGSFVDRMTHEHISKLAGICIDDLKMGYGDLLRLYQDSTKPDKYKVKQIWQMEKQMTCDPWQKRILIKISRL